MSEPERDDELTERQRELIGEIQRVACLLDVDRLSQREFDKHHTFGGLTTVGHQFGSWNRAVVAAGLRPNPQGGGSRAPTLDADDLLADILRVRDKLGKVPSEREIARFGRFSPNPYRDRWGGFVAARKAALAFEREGKGSAAQQANIGDESAS